MKHYKLGASRYIAGDLQKLVSTLHQDAAETVRQRVHLDDASEFAPLLPRDFIIAINRGVIDMRHTIKLKALRHETL
jgi:hypothetical protein